MRSKVVKSLALTLVLGGVGIALAQSPPGAQPQPSRKGASAAQKPKAPSEKSKLEGMLAEALRNNPDIRVAAANLTLAEAELNRTRLQVTQKVVALHHAILSQQATVDFEQKQYDRFRELLETRAIEEKLVEERNAKLLAAKAKLAELEAQLPALLGKTTRDEGKASEPLRGKLTVERARLYPLVGEAELIRTPSGDLELRLKNSQRVAGPMAEKIRQALARPISVDFNDAPVTQVVDDLSKESGLTMKIVMPPGSHPLPRALTMHCENLSLGAVLQLLEDNLIKYTIVVRDYGLLITTRESIPPGAITVQEFLRQKPAEK